MVLQNYQNLIEMTSNMIYIVALGIGFKCPRKIHLNPQCPPFMSTGPSSEPLASSLLLYGKINETKAQNLEDFTTTLDEK